MTWASTVTPSAGATANFSISAAMPSSMTASRAPRATSARCARRTRGFLKEGTALAMASTPVSDAQPFANAFSNSSTPTVCRPLTWWETSTAGSRRMSPATTTSRIAPT
ncbi:hypothetical protein H4W80_002281 [Nonomuraea angiospora]|uniref:Uncharacterized protein n=1 Tax=Nonomuraea angiospora TaxID=46172 RepID=A0ABR9LUS0_9ACTN|nr:hypothetical protein [Nonomuraea angiospora]